MGDYPMHIYKDFGKHHAKIEFYFGTKFYFKVEYYYMADKFNRFIIMWGAL